jgi:hypothetical protein
MRVSDVLRERERRERCGACLKIVSVDQLPAVDCCGKAHVVVAILQRCLRIDRDLVNRLR